MATAMRMLIMALLLLEEEIMAGSWLWLAAMAGKPLLFVFFSRSKVQAEMAKWFAVVSCSDVANFLVLFLVFVICMLLSYIRELHEERRLWGEERREEKRGEEEKKGEEIEETLKTNVDLRMERDHLKEKVEEIIKANLSLQEERDTFQEKVEEIMKTNLSLQGERGTLQEKFLWADLERLKYEKISEQMEKNGQEFVKGHSFIKKKNNELEMENNELEMEVKRLEGIAEVQIQSWLVMIQYELQKWTMYFKGEENRVEIAKAFLRDDVLALQEEKRRFNDERYEWTKSMYEKKTQDEGTEEEGTEEFSEVSSEEVKERIEEVKGERRVYEEEKVKERVEEEDGFGEKGEASQDATMEEEETMRDDIVMSVVFNGYEEFEEEEEEEMFWED